jgi:hypothetical protein
LQISGVSLTLTLSLRLCVLRVFLGATATVTSFPLPKHTGGGGATHAFSGWCVYLQFTCEVSLPPSPVEFSSHCHFYKLSHSWLLGRCHTPAFSGWLVYLQFCEGLPLLPLRCSGNPALFATCLFYCFCLLFRLFFSLFFPGGCQSVQGAMLI